MDRFHNLKLQVGTGLLAMAGVSCGGEQPTLPPLECATDGQLGAGYRAFMVSPEKRMELTPFQDPEVRVIFRVSWNGVCSQFEVSDPNSRASYSVLPIDWDGQLGVCPKLLHLLPDADGSIKVKELVRAGLIIRNENSSREMVVVDTVDGNCFGIDPESSLSEGTKFTRKSIPPDYLVPLPMTFSVNTR